MGTAAAIRSTAAATLPLGSGGTLECLYAVVDGKADPQVSRFLATSHEGCDTTEVDWQAVRRPRSALVGIELVHTCDDPALAARSLRLVFDIERDADALERLVTTEALVIGTRPFGSFANVLAAHGVDGAAVRRAVVAARRSLKTVSVAT